MDRPAGVGGEIAPAVEDEPLPGRGDREEGSRDPLVVQSGAPDAQIVLQIARRGVAGLVLAGVVALSTGRDRR